jgi:hypothetical protein
MSGWGFAGSLSTVMDAKRTRFSASPAIAALGQCMCGARARALACALIGALSAAAALPATADAHGPTAPVATSYRARVSGAPPSLDARVVDGYLRMWLRAPPSKTVVVLDYRGAPYVRFSSGGVYVNENSEMDYLNQSPPESPPLGLNRGTPPKWLRVSDGHEYVWHDGRIGALAATALVPGVSYLGSWSISLLVDGRLRAISGGLWHAHNPSLVWFWPIAVLIACVLAAWRLRQPELHARLARWLAVAVLIAIGTGAGGRELYGRPTVAVEDVIVTCAVLAFVAWGLARVLLARAGYILDWVIACVALWIGLELLPTLVHGFVLTAVPPFVARSAAVLCLGGSVGLPLLAARKVQHASGDLAVPHRDPADDRGLRSGEALEHGPTLSALSAGRGSARGPGARPDPRWPR